jgi:hypothetical protein
MDNNKKEKSDLGNEKKLTNAEKDTVTGIKTSDLPKGKGPVTPSAKKPNGSAESHGKDAHQQKEHSSKH